MHTGPTRLPLAPSVCSDPDRAAPHPAVAHPPLCDSRRPDRSEPFCSHVDCLHAPGRAPLLDRLLPARLKRPDALPAHAGDGRPLDHEHVRGREEEVGGGASGSVALTASASSPAGPTSQTGRSRAGARPSGRTTCRRVNGREVHCPALSLPNSPFSAALLPRQRDGYGPRDVPLRVPRLRRLPKPRQPAAVVVYRPVDVCCCPHLGHSGAAAAAVRRRPRPGAQPRRERDLCDHGRQRGRHLWRAAGHGAAVRRQQQHGCLPVRPAALQPDHLSHGRGHRRAALHGDDRRGSAGASEQLPADAALCELHRV